MSDFGILNNKFDVSKSAIMNIFKSISVITKRNNIKLSDFLFKMLQIVYFGKGRGLCENWAA